MPQNRKGPQWVKIQTRLKLTQSEHVPSTPTAAVCQDPDPLTRQHCSLVRSDGLWNQPRPPGLEFYFNLLLGVCSRTASSFNLSVLQLPLLQMIKHCVFLTGLL